MSHPKWTRLHPNVTVHHLGLLPGMLSSTDPRPAREQLDNGYAHGGGWQPFEGFTMRPDGGISYPGDPVHMPLAECRLRDERVVLYDYSWVAIVQRDGSFEIARMD